MASTTSRARITSSCGPNCHACQLWAEKVLSVHGERHPELNEIAACYATIRADLEPHLTKEERMLLPAVVALEQQLAA